MSPHTVTSPRTLHAVLALTLAALTGGLAIHTVNNVLLDGDPVTSQLAAYAEVHDVTIDADVAAGDVAARFDDRDRALARPGRWQLVIARPTSGRPLPIGMFAITLHGPEQDATTVEVTMDGRMPAVTQATSGLDVGLPDADPVTYRLDVDGLHVPDVARPAGEWAGTLGVVTDLLRTALPHPAGRYDGRWVSLARDGVTCFAPVHSPDQARLDLMRCVEDRTALPVSAPWEIPMHWTADRNPPPAM